MKRKIFLLLNILLFVFVSQELKSQDTATIYFDKQWNQCDKELSSYYRKYYVNESKEYNVRDFYNSGQLQMVGTYKKPDWKEKTGHFTFYYENGQKKSEGEYFKDKRTGKWVTWQKDGNIRYEADYKNGKIVSLIKAYDKGGNLLAEYAGNPKILDNYSDFESSMTDFQKFLSENIQYPEQAKQYGRQGKVFVSFYIDANGNAYDLKVLRGVSDDIDKEALRVVKLFKWPKPRYKGKGVILKFMAPVKFTLT